jgi:hypothetical protein
MTRSLMMKVLMIKDLMALTTMKKTVRMKNSVMVAAETTMK